MTAESEWKMKVVGVKPVLTIQVGYVRRQSVSVITVELNGAEQFDGRVLRWITHESTLGAAELSDLIGVVGQAVALELQLAAAADCDVPLD
jgi:hypothetical protein